MKLKFDVTIEEYEIIRDILAKNLPDNCKVWVFGSRAKNQARFNSDIDLAIEAEGYRKIGDSLIYQLKDEFTQSMLPYQVDVLDFNDVSELFQEIINQQKVAFPLKARLFTPKLRFPEFKEKWEKKRLGEVCSLENDKFDPKKQNSELRVIELDCITSGNGRISKFYTSKKIKSIKTKFKKNHVLFGKLRPYLKKYWLAKFDGVCSSEIWALSPRKIVPYILYCIVQSTRFFLVANQSSGTRMPRADWNIVKNLFFYLPTLPEQEKIASFLSKVDKRIEQLEKKRDLLEKYKKGMMQQIFSQKLRFKDENGNNYPNWQEKKLGEVLEQLNNRNKNLEIELILSVSNKNGFVKQTEQFEDYQVASKDLSNYKIVKRGDIAYNPSRINVGSIALLESFDLGIISPMYIVFSVKKDLDSQFFMNFINTKKFYNLVKANCSGSVRESLNYSDLARFRIPLPTLPEQEKIASFLSQIDERITHANNEIETNKTYKKSLLQQMFV